MNTQEKYNSVFPMRLRELIREHNTTITALSKVLGISRQAVSQYADGTGQPNIDKLVAIAKYFDVSTDYLVGLSDYKRIETEALTASDLGITDLAAKELVRSKQGAGGIAGAILSCLVCSKLFGDLGLVIADYLHAVQHAEKFAHSSGGIWESERNVRIKKFLVSEKLFDLLDDVSPVPDFKKRIQQIREDSEL